MNPTPDIGELRRLREEATAAHCQHSDVPFEKMRWCIWADVEIDYAAALRNAAPALLAAAEEGERLRAENEALRTEKMHSGFAPVRLASPERINESHTQVAQSWFDAGLKHGEHLKYTQSREEACYLCTMLELNARLKSRLALAEAVVGAAKELTDMHRQPCGTAHYMGTHCYICAVKDALSTYEGKSET